MTTPKTPGKAVQDAIVLMLTEEIATLGAGGRPVTLFDFMPDQSFSQKALPMVVVEYPELREDGGWSVGKDKIVLEVPILLVDSMQPKPEGEVEVKERLALLYQRVKAVFALPENKNLRLPELAIFWSHCTIAEEEIEPFGNGLFGRLYVMSVPAVADRGSEF